jgi:hypothetical protein
VPHDLLTTIRPGAVLTSDLPGTGSVAHPRPGPRANADIGAGISGADQWCRSEETPVMSFNIPDCVPTPPTFDATRDMASTVKDIDMNQFICGQAECSAVVGNVLVYFGGHHLTSMYSKTLTPCLKPRLLSALGVSDIADG